MGAATWGPPRAEGARVRTRQSMGLCLYTVCGALAWRTLCRAWVSSEAFPWLRSHGV